MPKNLFAGSEELDKRIPELFEISEDVINEDIKTIKNWLKTQPHLPEVMENVKIKNFLVLNKFCVEKTKQKIDMYYTIRSFYPEFFHIINPNSPNMKENMNLSYFVVHPVLLEDKYRVFFFKLQKSNTLIPRFVALQCYNIQEIRLYEDCMVGEVVICDFANITLDDILEITPPLMAKALSVHQKVYAHRLKALHIINSPSYITHFKTLLKSSMKPKIFERVHIHQDNAILKEIFPNEILPKDYGGDGPALKELNDMLKLKFEEYKSRFDALDQMRVNEDLRPEQLKNDEVLGFHGNFKKLNVD